MRDTYVEKVPDGTGVYSFVIDGMQNMLIDGLFHEVDGYPPPPPTQPPNPDSFLLQTGPLGLSMGRITNAQVVCTQNPLSGTAVVQLANAGDGLIIDHSMEVSNLSGATRDIIVVGTGAILPSILPTVPSGSILKLPNGSDDAFLVSGTTTITDIIEKRPKRRVTLMFADNAVMQVSASLILNGMFAGGADRTISLLCDGTRWIELSRNKTYAERLAATLANNSQTPSVAGNTLFICSNSSSTAITNFMDAEPGQEVTILFTNGNTSIQGGGNFRLVGSFVSAAHATLRLLWDGTSWVELSRSAPQ
jgi:hypothetical protein